MAYYYYERRLQGAEPLFTAYDNNHQPLITPLLDRDDSLGIRLSSVVQKEGAWSDYYFKFILEYIHREAYASDDLVYMSFAYAMMLTGDPQLMGIFVREENGADEISLKSGHAILAYRITKDKIYVCDPNYPGRLDLAVPFNGTTLGPYNSTTSADQPGKNYNSFSLVAKSALFDWGRVSELFEEIDKAPEESTVGDQYFSKVYYKVIVDIEDSKPVFADEPVLVVYDDAAKLRIRDAFKMYSDVPDDFEDRDYLIAACTIGTTKGVVSAFSGVTYLSNLFVSNGEYKYIYIPIEKGKNNIGLYFRDQQEFTKPGSNEITTSYEFIDFIRIAVENGEEDLSGNWEGSMQITDFSKVTDYAQNLGEWLTKWILKGLLSAFVEEMPSDEEISQAVSDSIEVNEAVYDPIPMKLQLTKLESDRYKIVVSTTTEGGDYQVETQAVYKDGRLSFEVPYEDGSVFNYELTLFDSKTLSGDFTADAVGMKNALIGNSQMSKVD